MPTMRRMSTTSTGTVVLSQLLSANTVKLALAGTTRDEVLLELIAQIPQLLDQAEARQRLFTALLERERLHSTGIGDGGPGRPFLFLDEPLSAFDTDRRALFMALLRTMQPNFQQIFLISHLPDVAPQLDHYLSLSWDGPHLSIHRSWQGETP